VLTLVWRESAREDVKQITAYIGARNFAAARGLKRTIEAVAESLPEHPLMYRRGRTPVTREAVVHPNYILVYRITSEAIEVVNVLHARQQYP
jgi:addiction module RelE/StbE family toxin